MPTTTPPLHARLCDEMGASPDTVLPHTLDPTLADRFTKAALAGKDIAGAAGMVETLKDGFRSVPVRDQDFSELRLLVLRARQRLGWLDREIGVLTEKRERLERLLKG